MKRTIIVFLPVMLLLGCARISDEASNALPEQPVISVEPSEVPNAAVPNLMNTPSPMPFAAETETATEVPTVSCIGCTSPSLSSSLPHEITVREVNWALLNAEQQYDTTFRNETVDFRSFRYTIEDFRSDENGTQFTIRLQLPKEWTDLQCLSMNPCFGFRFYLDDKAQNDFMLIDQSVIFGEALTKSRCDSFTMTYRSNAVTESVMHAAYKWTIVPFYYYHTVFGGSKYNDHSGGYIALEKGEVCRFNGSEDAFWGGKIGITELTELSLSLPIGHVDGEPIPSREPRMLQVSVWTEDVARNKAAGNYGSDGRIKDGTGTVYGTYQNHTVDFSGFEIHFERFYYWEHGFFMIMRYDFPSEWPDEVRRNLRLEYNVYADGELFGEPTAKEGHKRSYFKGSSTCDYGGYPEYRNETYGLQMYAVYDQKNFSLESPFPAKELTFKFSLVYFPTVSDSHDRKYDLTNGKPFYVDRLIYGDPEEVPLFEITIPTNKLVFQSGGAK